MRRKPIITRPLIGFLAMGFLVGQCAKSLKNMESGWKVFSSFLKARKKYIRRTSQKRGKQLLLEQCCCYCYCKLSSLHFWF
jgi:hypothetical protein